MLHLYNIDVKSNVDKPFNLIRSSNCIIVSNGCMDLSSYGSRLTQVSLHYADKKVRVLDVINGIVSLPQVVGDERLYFWPLKDDLYYNKAIMKSIQMCRPHESLSRIRLLYDEIYFNLRHNLYGDEFNPRLKKIFHADMNKSLRDAWVECYLRECNWSLYCTVD